MSDVTIAQFADVLKIPVEKLLAQLDQAGIRVSGADDVISDDAKRELLTHLRRSHGHDEGTAAAAPRKITLSRRSQSEIKVASAQGRAKTVTVEVRRKRTYVNRDVLEQENKLQQDELDRQRQEEQARLEQERAERDAKERAERERREQELAAAEAARKAEEEARRAAEQAAKDGEKTRLQDEIRKRDAEARARKEAVSRRDVRREVVDELVSVADEELPEEKPALVVRKELHVSADVSGRRKKKKSTRRRSVSVQVDSGRHAFERPTAPVIREVAIPETIKVGDLAQRMAVKSTDVIRSLMKLGVMATINQAIDQDTATLVVEELGHTAKPVQSSDLEQTLIPAIDEEAGEAVARPPVVTIMGHVDHGKTSLLDYIRRTKVAAGEAGGITQHIGAYHVTTPRGVVTFLDTPGHAAFTAMRARGAQVTDIVVLVVAADDGVMPQTEEAIQHAKAAEVPIIVAVNKVDKSGADPDRVRNELSAKGVIPEEWGGDTLFVNVSAHTGQGVDQLLESILLQSELLELTAVAEGRAAGVVLESSLEKGRGAVSTILVTRGKLRLGDALLAGHEYGRVRAMTNEAGVAVTEAGPSQPVSVLGLSGTPNAGDDAQVLEDERKARELAQFRLSRTRDVKLAQQQATKLEDVFSQLEASQIKSLAILIKADVQGSAEALRDAMNKLAHDEVNVKVIGASVGGVTASDVTLAAASKAIIIAFNVRADGAGREAIKETGVDVRYYSIIYEALDDVKRAVTGMLSPIVRDQIVGLAEVREVFRSPKFGNIAGCLVVDGYVKRNNPIRVLRNNTVIYEGELESLRRFKDDVSEVRAGTECGIGVRNYDDVKPGDQIECYERVTIDRST